MKKGGSAQDAVEQCVILLENDPLYNAGKGSVLNAEGAVEMDASIMDGKSLRAGAIAGVKKIKNPISVARKVMEETEYVFMEENSYYREQKNPASLQGGARYLSRIKYPASLESC